MSTVENDLPTSFDVEPVPFEDRMIFDAKPIRGSSRSTPPKSAQMSSPTGSSSVSGTSSSAPAVVPPPPTTSRAEIASVPLEEASENEILRSIPVEELGRKQADDEALVAKAKDMLEHGRTDEAIRTLYEATSLNPHNGLAYHLLGMAYMTRNEPSKAVSSFDQAIRYQSNVPATHLYRGIAHVKLQDNALAIDDLDEAAKEGGSQPEIHIWRAIAHLNLRHSKEATQAAERAIELNGKSPDAYFVRALARMQSGRPVEGRADFKRAIELGLDPNSQAIGRKYFPGS